jgi:hypothetical protein
MGQLNLSGTVQAGPAQVSDTTFPSGETTIPFVSNPSPKGYNNDTGKNVTTQFASPSSFATLAAVGPGGPVIQANFLYLRTSTQIAFRLTQLQPASSPTTAVVTVAGVLIVEPAPGFEITLVEAQGAGTIEWYACGNQ